MGMGWSLFVVPEDPRFKPEGHLLPNLMSFIAERLDSPDGYLVDDEDEVSATEAAAQLARAAGSQASTICRLFPEEDRSDVLFGWDENAKDPDANFWFGCLRIQITSAPCPYFDYEMGEDALCPYCRKSVLGPIQDRIDDDFSLPLTCACGKSFPSIALKFKGRGRTACFSIGFTCNKGWHGDYRNPRKAFKDATFLPALKKILGTPLEVLAKST